MITFQIVVGARMITCERVQKRLPKSRLIFQASGVEFYVLGKTANRFDQVANVAMNCMLEIGRRASELRTVK